MSKHTIRVEMTIPQTLLVALPVPGQREVERVLRAQGLLLETAEQVRWRVDHMSAGYIVEFVVPLCLDEDMS